MAEAVKVGAMTDHPQAQAFHPSGDLIEVDENLVPVLTRMWRRGIVTTDSCQDQEGRVWVEFASQRDVEVFLLAMFRDDEDEGSVHSFRTRVFGISEPTDEVGKEDLATVRWRWWWWDVNVVDMNKGEGPVCVEVYHSVRFPTADLEEVTRRLGGKQETRVVDVGR
jgi:hypothetical protein